MKDKIKVNYETLRLTDKDLNSLMIYRQYSFNWFETQEKIQEYCDIFILICESGLMANDIWKLFHPSQYEIIEKDGLQFLYIKNTPRIIQITDRMKEILDRRKNGFYKVNFESPNLNDLISKWIKSAAWTCYLRRKIDYYDEKGGKHRKPLYEIISVELARITYYYNNGCTK